MSKWIDVRLGTIFDVKAGGDLQVDKFSKVLNDENPYPIFSNSLENKGLYGYTSNPRYPEDCVTITGRGALGHAEYRDTQFDAIVRLLVLIPKVEVDGKFVTYYINNLVNFAVESTGVPQLPAPRIKKVKIYLPQLTTEQNAISSIICKVDKAIETVNESIKATELLKKSLMQNLLTGKLRADGVKRKENDLKEGFLSNAPMKGLQRYLYYKIPRDWSVLQLKKILDLKYGIALSDKNRQGNLYPVFGSNGVVGFHKDFYVKAPGIVIGRKGTAGAITWSDKNFTPIDTTYYVEEDKDKVILEWLYYALQLLCIDKLNAATGVPGLNRRDVLSLFILVPSKDEQLKIVEVIKKVQSAIDEKHKKIQMLNKLKKSLMQNLLTGKVRLDVKKINKLLKE